MQVPRPSILHLATAVVVVEVSRSDVGQEERVVDRTMIRLREQFGRFLGPTGFDVLFIRSLVIARQAHPFLASCEAGPGGRLSWPEEAEGDLDRASEGRVAIVVLSHFLELLALLIGEDLSERLVHDVWPDLPDTNSVRDQE